MLNVPDLSHDDEDNEVTRPSVRPPFKTTLKKSIASLFSTKDIAQVIENFGLISIGGACYSGPKWLWASAALCLLASTWIRRISKTKE